MADEDTGAISDASGLSGHDVLCLRAANPGPLTLSGTNTWVLGRDPAYVIDPGPTLEAHVSELVEAVERRGGLGGIALTHDHPDHCEAVGALRGRLPAPVAAGRGDADVKLLDGVCFGPLQAFYTPGHAPDHFALIAGKICFTGDAVLGEGSVFVSPEPGSLAGYLRGLERLRQLELDALCPGHGPVIWDARARLDHYIDHRLERERMLLRGLAEGRRTVSELLDAAWSEVPEQMRPVASVTLAAHLQKLSEEERLPDDVQWPTW